MNKHFAEVVNRSFRNQTVVNDVTITIGDLYVDETGTLGTVIGIHGDPKWEAGIQWEPVSRTPKGLKCYGAEHFLRVCTKEVPQ